MSTQTRYETTLNGALTDVQTTANVDEAPAFTSGYGTFERGTAQEEDFKWQGLSGLQMTSLLRGLSKTALTDTEVTGNKKAHLDGKTVEGTILHYILNNKADLDEDETFTGTNTFANDKARSTTNAAPSSELAFTNKKYVDDKDALNAKLSGGNTFSGNQVFADNTAQTTTDAAPNADKILANKKYVDDQVAAVADFPQPLATAISDVTASAAEVNKLDNTSANVTATNLNTLTAGATSNGDALHGHSSLIGTGTAGENIDGSATPKACFISRGVTASDAFPLQVQETEANTDVDVYGVNFSTQTFTTSTFQTVITRVDLLLMKFLPGGGAVSGNISVDIFAVDGAHKPTGLTLGTKTYTADSVVATYNEWVTFSFASAITVTGATEYATRMTVISGDGTHYVAWCTGTGSTYSGGQPFTSSDAGTTWSASTNDFGFRVWGYEPQTAGQIYMSDSDEPFRGAVDGFVISNTTAGNSATLVKGGKITTSGLTAGTVYYVDSTIGGITATPGGLKVGLAKSTTELDIDFSGGFVEKTVLTIPTVGVATTTPTIYGAVFQCGFKPSRVELIINLTCSQGGGADNRIYLFDGRYVGSLYGSSRWDAGLAAAGVQHGVSGVVSAATSFQAINTAANTTVTAGGFSLTNTGLYFTVTAAGAGTGGGYTQAIFYR